MARALIQIETKQDSVGIRDSSFETESHQQHLRQSLRSSLDGSPERRRRPMHLPLGEESGSQLAARLNSSTFATEQVKPQAQYAYTGWQHGPTCGEAVSDTFPCFLEARAISDMEESQVFL